MSYAATLDVSLTTPLHIRIDRIYDHLFANAAVRTPNGIGIEVGKLLHTGLYGEIILKEKPAFNLRAVDVHRVLHGDLEFISDFASHIREVYSEMNLSWNLYGPSSSIALSDFDICITCAYLNGVVLSDKRADVLGEAVEVFRSQWAKRAGGQFFTDPQVTSLAMRLLDFDPRNGDDLIDVCAGTGGFLLAGLNHIAQLLKDSNDVPSQESRLISLACSALKGQEIDPDICEAANSTLKSRLGERGSRLVELGDSLSAEAFSNPSGRLRLGGHMCAASNPPFGTKITIKDPDVLRHYELAMPIRSNPRLLGSPDAIPQPPDILFLERNLEMLKPGKGRVAIVLPYQILSGPKARFVREWLLRQAYVKAIIDLPPETFQPYTGTKTALVVAERRAHPIGDPHKSKDYDIFMSMPRWIGHDRRGNPVYKRSPEGKTTNEILTDFDDVGNAYRLYKEQKDPSEVHPSSFIVKFESIARDPLLRVNALFHRPPVQQKSNFVVKSSRSSWKIAKLRELVEGIFYPGRFKRNYVEYFSGAVPFLGGSNVGEFIARTDKWLSPEDPNLPRLRIRPGWILITRSGTTGIVGIVPKAWDGFAMSEHVIRIAPDEKRCSPEYLFAFLRSNYGQEQLARGVFGSVIDEINPEHVGDIDVVLPVKSKVDEIVQFVKTAEIARQSGIENHNSAIEQMNSIFAP